MRVAARKSLAGRARVLGDDVNTDYIISSRRKKDSLDPLVLRQYLLEDVAPEFAASVRDGDILVAGRNFGCGSAMEVAVTVVRGAGIQAVVARSFARTYWRNAINNGLLVLTADTSGIAEGARLAIEIDGQGTRICVAGGDSIAAEPLPEFVLAMRDAGGLLPYLRRHGRLI